MGLAALALTWYTVKINITKSLQVDVFPHYNFNPANFPCVPPVSPSMAIPYCLSVILVTKYITTQLDWRHALVLRWVSKHFCLYEFSECL
jgi:hypothetical protein